ncbi:MAG: Lrp/AsnC ligand binding domain-containing protein [candidate division NC10 bacterium]|nr:Lrp/AsnC ligand binding domain-containing protein [candidate division NC10 bacterium]
MAKAILLITAEPGKDRAVGSKVKRIGGVEAVWLVSGLYDVAAIVSAETAEDILGTVYDKIRGLPGVKSSQTMFALQV